MASRSSEQIRKVTAALGDELLRERLQLADEITYRPVPHSDGGSRPTWRISLELSFNASQSIGLDVNGEVILGRGDAGPDSVALFDTNDADHLGVSRHHAMLRPTESKLYVIDLNSTNGTWVNGHSIGVNTPYSLSHGDLVTLGRLDVTIKFVNRPRSNAKVMDEREDLAQILPGVACAIIAQLEREDAMEQALEKILTLTEASEAGIWLVDEQTGELFLEAGMGANDAQVERLSIADTLPGLVIENGQPLRANREPNAERVKVKTGYLVEAVLYVPLKLADVTFGVLSAFHHEPGKLFTQREEELMMAIAEFTAVAIQNARLYQATNRALARRVKLITALHYALSFDMKNKVNAIAGYAGLLADDSSLDESAFDTAQQVVSTSHYVAKLIERLTEVTALSEEPPGQHQPCDLVDAARRAIAGLQRKATEKAVKLDTEIIGDPYIIQGDIKRLYRTVLNLVDNAIKYSPPESQVYVALVYWDNEIAIRVRDYGPGIPEEDLPYLFDRHFRSQPSLDGEVGLGLGLELVRETAEAHRGTVMAYNAEGGGAEFVVKLPATLRVV